MLREQGEAGKYSKDPSLSSPPILTYIRLLYGSDGSDEKKGR